MTDFVNMTDEELQEEYEKLWRRYMYYQAAEGNWSKEREARESVSKEYWQCYSECKDRGFENI